VPFSPFSSFFLVTIFQAVMKFLSTLLLLSQALLSADGRLVGDEEQLFQHPKFLDSRLAKIEDILSNEYVVVLHENTTNVQGSLEQLVKNTGGRVSYTYNIVCKGGLVCSMPMNLMSLFLDNKLDKLVSLVRENLQIEANDNLMLCILLTCCFDSFYL
jgi:hypothetical protein